MQTGDSTEQIKGMYLTQITEDGEFAVLSGSIQYSVSDQVIRGGVKIQKRDLETKSRLFADRDTDILMTNISF